MAKNDHFSTKTKSYRLTKIAKNGHFSIKTEGFIGLPKWPKMTIFRSKPKAIGLPKCQKITIFRTKPKPIGAAQCTKKYIFGQNVQNQMLKVYQNEQKQQIFDKTQKL